MIDTTLCYIEKDDCYLMLHRVKKENDLNKDKWIGVGGKIEEDETPEECVLREVKEETGLTLVDYKLRGIITFLEAEYAGERMFLFTASKTSGELIECNEGELEWVKKEDVYKLPVWEGDKLFFKELEKGSPFFNLKLNYVGDTLVDSELTFQ